MPIAALSLDIAMNPSAPMQRTPLYDLHREMDAKMVEFAGYEMPLHYSGGIIREHLHTRAHAGLFDISHMGQFLLVGAHSAKQLQRLIPSAIGKLGIGRQRYTVLSNEQGGVIDDIIVTRLAEDTFFIVVNAACKAKDFLYLQNRIDLSCSLRALDSRALLALQGPDAAAAIVGICPEAAELRFMQAYSGMIGNQPCIISRGGYTGEDGFEISLPGEAAATLARQLLGDARVRPAGLGARDTLRLEAGLCLYGHELTEAVTPVEAGLEWIIKLSNNRFPGASVMWRQLQHGPQRRRVGLLPEGKAPLRAGAVLKNRAGETVGTVTSGGYSPSLKRPIAMGLVAGAEAQVGNVLFAERNARAIAVTVAALPFVAHRYYRGES